MRGQLTISTATTRLRITRGGDLLPWIGPAVRGLVKHRLKNLVCIHEPHLRDTRWSYCKGCPQMDQCCYGQGFEPDAPPSLRERGRSDAPRPAVLLTPFPLPPRVQRQEFIELLVRWVGPAATTGIPSLLQALADGGSSAGIGPDHVRFDVETDGTETAVLESSDLPVGHVFLGRVPTLRIDLVAPLFLMSRDEDGRRSHNSAPALVDLVFSAAGTIRDLFHLHSQPLEVDLRQLINLAERARLVDHGYESFEQQRVAERGTSRFEMQGIHGWGEYADVPLTLIPWLTWGGRIHVGTHRVAGAGGWQVTL